MRFAPLLAAGLATALALWSALEFHGSMRKAGQGDPYRIQQLVELYQEFARTTPVDARLGYGSPAGDVKGQVLYYAAKYALAPRVVTNRPGPPSVLFHDEKGIRLEQRGAK
jgi:hypothetical protein